MKIYLISSVGFLFLLCSCDDKKLKTNDSAALETEQIIEIEKEAEILEENAVQIQESTKKLDALLNDL